MSKYYRYYKYIRTVNPHIKARRVLDYIKVVERKHGLKVLSQYSLTKGI